MPDDTRTPEGLVIPTEALEWRFSRNSGPGGQHVNASDTRVELICDLTLLEGDAGAISRARATLGDSVRIVAADARSQYANRVAALQRLADRLDAAARPVRRRRPTRPSRGAVEARLQEKRELSQRKSERRRRAEE